MFVLMVLVAPPLLSDRPPDLPQRAGLGDRFHYFRGRSGRRYLFTVVTSEALADFRNVVAMLAEPAEAGRLAARAVVTMDPYGRIGPAADRAWPPIADRQTLCLVHLLAGTEVERCAVVADLASLPMQLAVAA
jgi:hypothetical protein